MEGIGFKYVWVMNGSWAYLTLLITEVHGYRIQFLKGMCRMNALLLSSNVGWYGEFTKVHWPRNI